jgi:hypothetical protein
MLCSLVSITTWKTPLLVLFISFEPNYKVTRTTNSIGLSLNVQGYNHKLKELLEKVIGGLTSPPLQCLANSLAV